MSVLWLVMILVVLLLVVTVVEIAVGPLGIAITKILPDAIAYFRGTTSVDAVVMGAVRLPRVVVAAFVGVGLASAGVALQAVFRNPMADPGVIGVSSGGSLGAVLVIAMGLSGLSIWVVPLAAFTTGLITVFVIYALATYRGYTSIYALLLSGVAIGSLAGAVVDLLLSLEPLQTMQQALFWLMGGLDGSTWSSAGIVAGFSTLGLLFFMMEAPTLDLLSLGDEQAISVGVHVEAHKRLVLVFSALVVGSCISVSGAIGFVGLIVPHVMRLLIGPSHRFLLLTSALGGAILLIFSDILARTVLMPSEINIGIVTSVLGVPFFLMLLRHQQKTSRLR
nr:iron ABC transporter permease [Bacilli bacterium]